MKIKMLSTLVIGAAIIASGCSSLNTNSDYNSPVNYSALQRQTDAKILGGVMTLDKNEIIAAKAAEMKATNPAVKNFAAYMDQAHSQNLQEFQALSQKISLAPMKGEVARNLQRQGRHTMRTLNRLHNGSFDRMFMDDMVKGHIAALQLLNQKLIPLASNPLLKRQLENTSHHVSEHLQKAKAIQAQLGR